VIRPARLDDRHQIRQLIIEMGGHDAIADSVEPLRVFGEVLTQADSRALVAERDGAIVGYAEIHALAATIEDRREARLVALCVSENARRSGVGAELIAEVERAASTLGCSAIVLESSSWRDDAHAFYRERGFSEKTTARRFVREVPARRGSLEDRFIAACGVAASAVKAAITDLDGRDAIGYGADGAPTEAADRAAEEAALEALIPLGVPIVSEEAGLVGNQSVDPDQPWISLDPLDGSRNFVAGYPPYAIAIGLIRSGSPLAGFVCELDAGHRWWAIAGEGAYRDGRRIRRRIRSSLAATPSPIASDPVIPRFEEFARVRISGSSTIDLCRVAEGSLGAFVTFQRPVIHVHDLAGPMAVILESGAVVQDASGATPVLVPDPVQTFDFVAAANAALASELILAHAPLSTDPVRR
jgi:fructose-1,6-bisphosphatase/inositol monophosphatase family enzyme/predicted N-acetyltransferase YhbS